jgi:hypothetical protein
MAFARPNLYSNGAVLRKLRPESFIRFALACAANKKRRSHTQSLLLSVRAGVRVGEKAEAMMINAHTYGLAESNGALADSAPRRPPHYPPSPGAAPFHTSTEAASFFPIHETKCLGKLTLLLLSLFLAR